MEAKFAKSDFKGNSGKFLIMFCDLTRYMISILFYLFCINNMSNDESCVSFIKERFNRMNNHFKLKKL